MAQMVAMESIDLNDTTVTIPAELPEEQIHIETAEERWILFQRFTDRQGLKNYNSLLEREKYCGLFCARVCSVKFSVKKSR